MEPNLWHRTTNSQSGWPPVKGSGNDTSLYGVNPEGGLGTNLSGCIANSDASGYGTVYKLTAQGTLSILHTFTSGTLDGAYPLGGLVQGTGSDSSNFYGVTLYGGSTNCTMPWGCCIPGYGTIFKVSTNGHYYTLLHSFNGGSDGAYPNGLFMGSDGFLYGANTYGGTNSSRVAFPGTNGLGTVFKISTNSNGGPITILHQFAPGQGIWPDAPMVQMVAMSTERRPSEERLTRGLCSKWIRMATAGVSRPCIRSAVFLKAQVRMEPWCRPTMATCTGRRPLEGRVETARYSGLVRQAS